MHHYKLRLLTALATFYLGVFVSQSINFLEDSITQHFYPVSEINSVTAPNIDPNESNEIYNVVLRTFKDAHSKLLVLQAESEGYVYIDYSDMAPPKDPHDKFSKAVRSFTPD